MTIVLLASSAQAQNTVTVACYSDTGATLSMSFDPAQTLFTFDYQLGGLVDNAIAYPQNAFGDKHSYVKILHEGPASLHVLAQIINGDVETPVFTASAEAVLSADAYGAWHLEWAKLYHNGVELGTAAWVQQPCYVQ
jgi:hypothetical protein